MESEQLYVYRLWSETDPPAPDIAPEMARELRDYARMRGYSQCAGRPLLQPVSKEWGTDIDGVRVLCLYLVYGDPITGDPPGFYVRADRHAQRDEKIIPIEAWGL